MLSVRINSKRESYEINLKRKITVIRGDSGTGKTGFTKAAENNSGAYKKIFSDKRFSFQVISGENWEAILTPLSCNNGRYVFIFDDVDFIVTSAFSTIVSEDRNNYFIIINRFSNIKLKSLSRLSFAVDSVYEMATSGKHHWLEPYHSIDSVYQSAYDVVITEDSSSGLDFLRKFNEKISTSEGKSKVINLVKEQLQKLKNKRIFLFVDMAAFGSDFDYLFEYADSENLNITIIPEYESFEYLLLVSNFFKYDIEGIPDDKMLHYMSHEKLYEAVIAELTADKPYAYGKDTLNLCYVKDCCSRDKKTPCDKGIPGNKLSYLFAGTAFETLFKFIGASDLTLVGNG